MFIKKTILKIYNTLVVIVKKSGLQLLLILTLLLGEVYMFFRTPYQNKKSWFLLHPIDPFTLKEISQSVTWYIKDSAEGLTWIIFLWVWYTRERKMSKFWSWLILLFLIFRIVDLLCYWLNHRHASIIYGLCYLSIIIYASYSNIKEYKKYRNKKK